MDLPKYTKTLQSETYTNLLENMDKTMENNVHVKFNKLIMEIPFFMSSIFGNNMYGKSESDVTKNTCDSMEMLEYIYKGPHYDEKSFTSGFLDILVKNYFLELDEESEKQSMNAADQNTTKDLIIEYSNILKNVDISTKYNFKQVDFYEYDINLKKYNDNFIKRFDISIPNEQHTFIKNNIFKQNYELIEYIYPTLKTILRSLYGIYKETLLDEFITIEYLTKGWFQFYISKLEDYVKNNVSALLYQHIFKKILNKMIKNNNIFNASKMHKPVNKKYFRFFAQFKHYIESLKTGNDSTPCNKLFFYIKENTFNTDNIPVPFTSPTAFDGIKFFKMDDTEMIYGDNNNKTKMTISKEKGSFFSNEVEPAVLSGLLSISNIIKDDESCVLFSYGYSGVGKTTNIFGSDDNKDSSLIHMIIQNVKDTHNIEVCVNEFYGISLNNTTDLSIKSYEFTNGTIEENNPYEPNEQYIPILDSMNTDPVNKLLNIIKGIDESRKQQTPPKIVETSNNPTSSRSFILYKFKFTNNKNVTDPNFLYVYDMPGVENPSLDSITNVKPSTFHFNMFFEENKDSVIHEIITDLYYNPNDSQQIEFKNVESTYIDSLNISLSNKNVIDYRYNIDNFTNHILNTNSFTLYSVKLSNNIVDLQFMFSSSTSTTILKGGIKLIFQNIIPRIILLEENDVAVENTLMSLVIYYCNKYVQPGVNQIHGLSIQHRKNEDNKYATNMNTRLWNWDLQELGITLPTHHYSLNDGDSTFNFEINEEILQQFYATRNVPYKITNIDEHLKKKVLISNLEDFDVNSQLVEEIKFMNEDGKRMFRQYMEGKFINDTLNTLSNDIYTEMTTLCYRNSVPGSILIRNMENTIKAASYVVNFFVISNFNQNKNLIEALKTNANASKANQSSKLVAPNYNKYIYDTQFNIINNFKRFFN